MAYTRFIRASRLAFLVFTFSTASVAQNQSEKFDFDCFSDTPLLTILQELMSTGVNINFDHDLVKKVTVRGTCRECSVEEVLDKFLPQGCLRWEKVGERQYSIYRNEQKGSVHGFVRDAVTKELIH